MEQACPRGPCVSSGRRRVCASGGTVQIAGPSVVTYAHGLSATAYRPGSAPRVLPPACRRVEQLSNSADGQQRTSGPLARRSKLLGARGLEPHGTTHLHGRLQGRGRRGTIVARRFALRDTVTRLDSTCGQSSPPTLASPTRTCTTSRLRRAGRYLGRRVTRPDRDARLGSPQLSGAR